MKTLIKLYSSSPIRNVYAALLFEPEQIVFLGGKEMREKQLKVFFREKLPSVKMEFYTVDLQNLENISQVLEEILKKYPESAVELCGGGNLLYIAVGELIGEQRIPAFFYDIKNAMIRNVSNFKITEEMNNLKAPKLQLEDFVLMAGGSLEGYGHIGINKLSPEMQLDIEFLWNIFFDNQERWRRLIDYLQNKRNSLLTDPSPFSLHERMQYNDFIEDKLSTLASSPGKIIRDLNITQKQINFSYKNDVIKKCLNDKGLILELYLFLIAMRMDFFDEVRISTIIDWNGIGNEENNISNELDVTLVKGTRPIFISCKLKIITVEDLNEIDMLVKRFGGECGIGVVATVGTFSTDFPTVYRRAREMGIHVIEYDDFKFKRVEKILGGLTPE
ncbi:PDDEXK family nuclease [Parasporobacterium paucivorans]|uniref:Restriction endonuclease n=1 Tax=Parasporobacterium paucivorans DSM 15970 TaxID=1122934 RepID=A0A1M6GX18_9FIRM|nr:hypothetical protein [Parasporobacterium paucivorans]SHJ14405.1 hypothetical protein SAMN02745691_01415 [Parasporobacterium paucivorans DSM 15970]